MAAFTLHHVGDLACWAFGPGARVRHLSHEYRDYRCEIVIPRGTASAAYYGATWAEAFAHAGWAFPDPPKATYIRIGKGVFKMRGISQEQIATANTNKIADLIAYALNRVAK